MGTWNNLQEGFTVNERLPDTLVDVAICNVYFSVANVHRQKEQIKKPPCVTLGLEFLVLKSISIPKVLGPF
ncbi:hypothetical protein KQ229_09575 [Lactobacillus helveticus]|uniref:Transposase n=1 Tax=Lactobacillus helveticus TaxID=1587 RepID=A0AAU8XWR8_LACHE|nr:hypothetical protein [Lactobacillus helveticus]ANZ56341.1 hypothetical protein BCM45_07915 [Lactobacillus helveticus]AUI75120.1 hypothetical protein Lh8105_10515 [Lactobacillus helveticus]MBU5980655.1 hypothetical protein [Lactobacillus helveticus]MBU6035203.1 hypothetical protein [Lactobacillus helveticus]MBW1219999.1 hypothetical protein [Lactobacillus helveticus]